MDYYNVRKLITVLLLFLCAFAMYLFLTSTPQMRQSYIDRLWMIQGNRPVVKDWYTQAEMDRYNNGWRIQDDPNFVNYIRKKWLDYPSRRKVNVPDKDYSQFGEKATIDRLLDGKRNGFFFEVGALDGQLYSNTLNLEVSMNWTGILVEPDPINYGNLRKLNRNSYSLNVCLSPNQSAILPFLMNSAMSTLVKTNRYDVNKNKKKIDVQCFPLYSVLLAVGRTQIDFFSLDVEGAEEAILKSLPFDKVDIKLFIIEYLHDDKKIRAQRLENLKRIFDKVGGYKFVGTHNDIDAMFKKI